MSLRSGQDTDQTSEVSGQWRILKWSYSKLDGHGDTWNFAAPARPRPFSEDSPLCFILHQQPVNYLLHYVWGRCDQLSKSWTSKFKTWVFYLPLGGATPVLKIFHMTAFRAGPWCNLQRFVKIGPCEAELWQLPVSWEMVDFRQAATATPFVETWSF